MLIQFAYLAAVGAVGAWLTNRPRKNYALGLPIVYLFTLVALVAAGSKTAQRLGLEAVIFSLLAGLLVGNLSGLPA